MRGRALALAAAAALLAGAALPGGAPAEESGPVHEVRRGQTLWRIAEITVGDPTLWPALYLANRDQIKDPARVYPGQRLAIPEIEPGERAELRREAANLTARSDRPRRP